MEFLEALKGREDKGIAPYTRTSEAPVKEEEGSLSFDLN